MHKACCLRYLLPGSQ
ncbi:MAG: (2Fe-2S)-binding protein [Butyrivibrio sp.]|nr:(2Fe-2S)-binding protein [Butyrivibrio sp.]